MRLLGLLLGRSLRDTLLLVVLPIMGGGVTASAVPMTQRYADSLGGPQEQFLSAIVPVIILANVLCILTGGIYNGLTERRKQWFVGFNGFGEMLQVKLDPATVVDRERTPLDYAAIGAGLLFSTCAYLVGELLGRLIPAIHPYAWLILLVAALKVAGVLPAELEHAAEHWYQFIARALVPAVLVWVSFAMIDVPTLVAVATNPGYLALTVAAAALAAGFFGWLARIHFIESSITAGLCMADLGGSGDIATLGAANRMQLMPFAQISSRLGGALVLLLASALLPLFS